MKFRFLLCFFLTSILIFNLSAQNINEILGRPADSSITVSVMSSGNINLYVVYGKHPGQYTDSTIIFSASANIPVAISLTNLDPDTQYYYCTRYKNAGAGIFISGTEHSFFTQRQSGKSYVFTVESDVHLYDKKGCENLYKICLQNEAQEKPDFMINMGDTFGDDHHPFTITNSQVDSLHKVYRPILGNICHSLPYLFCMGNHEGEMNYYLSQTPPNNLAVYGTLARKKYFSNPVPDNFYSGNTDVEPYGMGQPENYYAWTWGDALFVVLDVYRYQSISDTTAKPQKWDWTLGWEQYSWLKNTLENSTATYKFVFAHQIRGQGRGGIADAPYYEWGGLDGNGNNLFASKRPGWDKPIHQLFVDNGVNIFFHGHDHLFSHEVLDGVIYQEVPMPSDSTYKIGVTENGDAYLTDTLGGSGFLKVFVSPECVKVDFVRAYLPTDTASGLHHNREIAFSYHIGNCDFGISSQDSFETQIKIFPNPSPGAITVELPQNVEPDLIKIFDIYGNEIIQTNLQNIDLNGISSGLYFIQIRYGTKVFQSKFILEK